MKALLLAFLVSGPFMTPATPDPKTTSNGPFPSCANGQVYSTTSYYTTTIFCGCP
jgi:hypothetical protein